MMRKKIALIMVLAMLLLSACGGGSGAGAGSNSGGGGEAAAPIRFGIMGPITGPNVLQGTYASHGADIFERMINEDGGILGRPVEVIFEDLGETEQSSISTYTKLASRGDLSGIGIVSNTNFAIAVDDVAKEMKFPTCSSSASNAFPALENPYFWMLRASETVMGEGLISLVADDLGYQRIAIIHGTDSHCAAGNDALLLALRNRGMEPVIDLAYETNENQYGPLLAQISAAKPDVIVGWSQAPDCPKILTQRMETDLADLPFYGSTAYASVTCFTVAGVGPTNGVYSFTDLPTVPETDLGKKVNQYHEEMFDGLPDIFTSFSFDELCVMKAAVELAAASGEENPADPAVVNAYIPQVEHVEGASTFFTGNGKLTMGEDFYLVQWEEGNTIVRGAIKLEH
ncbi:MAG: ABC transporter substrate-binding protein [Peptococcaceae bacterium]|jgi:ABC-type branched-subunit amino acid transport system substrate-binding protein|nr:ABC transporter substrate-binding protein [Peptococcaceae bacterium]